MQKRKYIFFILILALVISCSKKKIVVGLTDKEATSNVASFNEDSKELSKIIETINIIDKSYVGEKVTKDKLYEEAIRGIVKGLNDPYSEYFNKEELESFNEQIDSKYVGVGMSIKKEKGEYLEVISPFIGSPSFKAGIQIGDKITKIDGNDVRELNSSETSQMLRGKKGTKVTVEVLRKNGQIEEITLVRNEIVLENLEYKMLENSIGYISLINFSKNVGDEVLKAVKDLKSKGMKKLIFDLRTNPGGSLKEAVDIASIFTDKELMVTLRYKKGSQEFTRTLEYLGDYPMVILTNNGSASASEIVTGILKDYNRATIIGEKTYGKGVAQTLMMFKTGDGIKLTTAKYETPKKEDINKKGIQPDIEVKMNPLLAIKGYANETKEAKENRQKEVYSILEKIEGSEKAKKIINNGDIQLKEAIKFLNKVGK